MIPQMRLWPEAASILGRRDWNCVKGWSLSRAGQVGPECMTGGVEAFSTIVPGTSGVIGAVGEVEVVPADEGAGAVGVIGTGGAVGTV